MSKSNKNRLAALKAASGSGSSSTVAGLSSSLAFTRACVHGRIGSADGPAAVQGLELADPAQQKRKLEAANQGWLFDERGTFSVRPK